MSFASAAPLPQAENKQQPVVVKPTVKPATAKAGNAGPAQQAEFTVPTLTTELKEQSSESEMAAKILEWRAMLPGDLRKPASMSIEQLHSLVDNTIALSEVYRKRFPEGPARKRVLPAVCKLWVINNTRYFVSVSNVYKEQNGEQMPLELMKQVRAQYWDMVLTLIDEAIALNPEGSLHEELLTLKGQGSWFGQRYDNAVLAYKEVIEKYPNSPKASENLLALLNAYLTGRKFDQSIVIANQFLQKYPRDVLVPHVYQLKAKALLEGGRAQEALAWWLQSSGFLADAAAGRPVKIGEQNFVYPAEARQSFRRYADECGFMIGFLHGYLGNYEEARKAFESSLVGLNDLQAQNAIDPRSQVFLGRTDKVNTAYLTFVEKPAPGTAPTNNINAGTYVLEPSVVARIPAGREVSIERETFPALVADGALFAMAAETYWLDTGTPEQFVEANLDIVTGVRPSPSSSSPRAWWRIWLPWS